LPYHLLNLTLGTAAKKANVTITIVSQFLKGRKTSEKVKKVLNEMGDPVERIHTITGLSPEEIQQMSNEQRQSRFFKPGAWYIRDI
jgi:CO dehydrogenase nickel-insertion accessory protein CooC1